MALREINLISPDILERRSLIRHLVLWCGALFAVAILLTGGYGYRTRILYAAKQQAQGGPDVAPILNAVVGEIGKEQKALQAALKERVKLVAVIESQRPYSSILARLADIMNNQTSLTQLAFETGQGRIIHLRIMGISASHDSLGDFMQRLSNEPMFREVVLKFSQESDIKADAKSDIRAAGAPPVQFQVECDLAGSAS